MSVTKNPGSAVICLLLVTHLVPVGAIDVQTSVLAVARDYQGAGYCTGGVMLPCFDCSGFVQRVFRPLVPDIPRISRDQARFGAPINRSELRAGDLVFFATGATPGVITHVAIYMGQDSIIHAISNGPNRGVNITPLSGGYWERRFAGARRVLTDVAVVEAVNEQQAIAFARGTYSGDLRDGEPHGQGAMTMRNGDRYEGQFVNGLFEGQGVYVWQNGDRYEGSFRSGEMHGQGSFTLAGGQVTTGEWDMGRYQAPPAPPVTAEQPQPAVEPVTRQTYMQQHESPWDDWEGIVEGDFALWQQQQDEAFDDFMQRRQNVPDSQW